MKPNCFLGIDTSNYTTSAALLCEDGTVIANCKRPLPVAEGKCGLRQSDAVFAHVKNMPSLMAEIREHIGDYNLCAVGVSETPRRTSGSYMPCFLSGVAAAEAAGTAAGVPLYRFSHQCGHLAAAIFSAQRFDLLSSPFGAFHVSGGTTEMLYVPALLENGFSVQIMGGTADLNAGQLIDRVGVMLGLAFPAGPALEALAAECTERVPKPHASVQGTTAHFSGLQNKAEALFRETGNAPLVAAFVLDCVAETLSRLAMSLLRECGNVPILYAGGVMCNKRIRARLSSIGTPFFAEPRFSADNAAGIALLCQRRHGGNL